MPLSPSHPTTSGQDKRKLSLDRRLAISFWGLLFILTGAIWLFPHQSVPEGSWLVGVGLILVALNFTRYVKGIPVRVLAAILGGVALALGFAQLAGANLPLVPLALIVGGASIIF
jgi:hypothetical protein